MKKVRLYFFTFILSLCLGLGIVKADTEVVLSDFYGAFDDYVNDLTLSNNDFDSLISYYNQNYSNTYPVFWVSWDGDEYELLMFSSSPTFIADSDGIISFSHSSNVIHGLYLGDNSISTYTTPINTDTNKLYTPVDSGYGFRVPIISNINLALTSNSSGFYYRIPAFISEFFDITYQSFNVLIGDNFPTYSSLYSGSYIPSINFTEINLNNYSYVALSLKNYNQNSFSTDFIVLGQLCLTPVYDYGMKEKSYYNTGYQVQSCTPVSNSFTPQRVTILQNDINNHSIYYLKAYDTSISNIVKVDSSKFDITYITSQDASAPYVEVNGKTYPTIPYNDLTSSATQSTEEGYISGESVNVFDVSSDSSFMSTVFSQPLQALQTTWVTIVSFFAMIGTFIGLLPVTMQTFLYASFALSLVLGVLKMIL